MNSRVDGPVRVLQVTIGDGNYGGVASFLYSYYSHIDHSRVHFDFLYCGENSMQSKMDSPVLYDSIVTTLHVMKANDNGIKEYIKLLKLLKRYFARNEYDVVHINTSNIYVSACVTYAVNGKAICIAHSHNTKAAACYGSSIKKMIKAAVRIPCRNYLLKNDNYYFACSKAAGENLYGSKILKSNKFRVINNAIDISKYTYDPDVRTRVKKTDRLIFGHVGRLCKQKNPEFLVNLFYEIHELNSNTELWMIGEGELQEEVEHKIKMLGLTENVKLWGRRDDVANLMQAMDVFLLPSLYEGLSIVAVEAQAAGLPVYASTSISTEHKVTDLVKFLPLGDGVRAWAEKIVHDIDLIPERRDMSAEMKMAGYEINNAAEWLENFYTKLKNCSNV